MPASYSSSQLVLILVNGAVGGAVWAAIAHVVRSYTRHILAIILFAAAAFYVHFAAHADAGAAWITIELLGVLAFGAIAVAGVRGSAWWLFAGYAVHPVWDLALHTFGPGSFAPGEYPIACLTWDWVVAAYVLWRMTRDANVALRRASLRSTAS